MSDNCVYIRPEVAAKQERLTAQTPAEVGWFGTVMEINGHLIVDEIIVPRQEVSAGAVDYDAGALHEVLEEYADIAHRIKYFGHSHYQAGVHFSGTDTGEFIAPLREMGGMDFFICHVRNQKGDHKTRVDILKPFEATIDLKLVSLISNDVDKWAKEQLEEKVTLKKWTSISTRNSNQRATAHKTGGAESYFVVYSVKDVKPKGRYIVHEKGLRREFIDGKEVRSEEAGRSIQRSDEKRAEGKADSNASGKEESSNQTQTPKGAKKGEQKQKEEKPPKPSSSTKVKGEATILPYNIDEEEAFVGEVEEEEEIDLSDVYDEIVMGVYGGFYGALID